MPPFLVAGDDVAFLLPNGTVLFSNLTFSISAHQRIALVGPNGCGKSTLAGLLAGSQTPARGELVQHGRITLLEQEVAPFPDLRTVDYLGSGDILDALKRSESGLATPDDMALIGDCWSLEADLRAALDEIGLNHISLEHQLTDLSGGEWLRLRLLAALRTKPDLLILDEPSNHLDQSGRAWLENWLAQTPIAWLLISHDRRLLSLPQEIWELSPTGLDVYGGNFDHYMREKTAQQRAAAARVREAKQAERHTRRDQQVARERHEQRAAKGRKQRTTGSQSKILMDARKARSESTGSRLAHLKEARVATAAKTLATARAHVKETVDIQFDSKASAVGPNQAVLSLQDVCFAFGSRPLFSNYNLSLKGPVRSHLAGENGSGKSTLLHLVAERLVPQSGIINRHVPHGYLLQKRFDAEQETLIERCLAYRPKWKESDIRTSLARAALRGDKALCSLEQLSAGEQVRAELVRLLNCPEPAQLLLLDEPSNHLDLDALDALESVLKRYQGALIFTSHDPVFAEQMDVTDTIVLPAQLNSGGSA